LKLADMPTGSPGALAAYFLSLGQFHDDLIKNGSLPISVIELILLNDDSSVKKVLARD